MSLFTPALMAVALALPSFATVQDQSDENGFTSTHTPNEHTLGCLTAPTRQCALNAPLQTVVDESLALERARVLTAVAESLIDLGQTGRARQTLTLALEEARSAGLSLVMQEKARQIAPLLARAGQVDQALKLAESIDIGNIQDQVYAGIAEEAANAGNMSGAQKALARMDDARRAFWREMKLLSRAPVAEIEARDLAALADKVRGHDAMLDRYRGLVLVGILHHRLDQAKQRDALFDEADALLTGAVGNPASARATAVKVRALYDADLGDSALFAPALEAARSAISNLRSTGARQTMARLIGPAEAGTGALSAALERLDDFGNLEERVRYFQTLSATDATPAFLERVSVLLAAIESEIDDSYERDQLRLSLMAPVVASGAVDQAGAIVKAMEDDDNQAIGLARMAVMLSPGDGGDPAS
ncbi:hypothetical protein [Yunchengibacter salinarum]|uniref:hypothetical protein n=1 Tax=Yunchengibacter salinarum TaxID=3133399 RepID=UPI0035B59E95